MKTIQITNGKAFYEGLPVENFSLSWGHNISGLIEIIDDGKTWVVKDGTYPLPEGWDIIVANKCDKLVCNCIDLECKKQGTDLIKSYPCLGIKTARLIRKKQNSAHGYTEGAEIQPALTKEIVNRHGLLLALEFGFRQCEQGHNLDHAIIEFNKLLNSK